MWDFEAKMYQIQFGPDPAEGAYNAAPDQCNKLLL